MGEILIVCFLPLLQSRLEFRHGIKFFCPDKILFDCSDDSLRVGIALWIAVAGEYLMNTKFRTGFEESS